MKVEYELPVPVKERLLGVLAVVSVVALAAAVAAWLHPAHTHGVLALLASLAVAFGANTVTYETPVTGVTAPTAAQARTHQQVSAVITGDGAATSFTVTHNWGLSTADLAAGWAEVELEYLLAAGYTAAALITSKTANTVVFSCTAFTGAGLRVRVKRPWTPTR
jgi:hypothetical protein